MARPRKAWLAALLSFVNPGIGQLYNGTVGKALALLVGVTAVNLLVLWLMALLPVPPWNVPLFLGWWLLVHTVVAVHAAREARRLGDAPRTWHSRWYSLVIAWAVWSFVFVPGIVSAFRTACVQTFQVPTGAMDPTIAPGDYILANKAAYGVRLPLMSSVHGESVPARGDVIIFLFPEDRERMFIKRVIGLPGEEVEVREKTVYVDGRALAEPYARFGAEHGSSRYGFGPERVPPDSLFVLGDNRDNSRDGRFWGFLPLADVRGSATLVYFSWDAKASRVRWERIGRAIR
jgi:signal peptidase I